MGCAFLLCCSILCVSAKNGRLARALLLALPADKPGDCHCCRSYSRATSGAGKTECNYQLRYSLDCMYILFNASVSACVALFSKNTAGQYKTQKPDAVMADYIPTFESYADRIFISHLQHFRTGNCRSIGISTNVQKIQGRVY